MRDFKLPNSEIEAVDLVLGYLSEHDIDVDYFDRAKLVRSNAVVTLPELKTRPQRKNIILRSQLFIAGIFASTRAKGESLDLSDMDILFLNSPAGTRPNGT